MAEDITQLSRVERVRRMLEEDVDDPTLFSPRAVSTAPWDRLRKTDKLSENFEELDRAFQDSNITIIEAVEARDTVVVRWRLQGKWSGSVGPIRLTKNVGKEVDITGTNTYRFVGDRIVEKTGQFDVPAFHAVACAEASAADCQEALTALTVRKGRPV